MANLLTITKEDNETFSFIVNGNVSEEVLNNRNDLFTFGNECHFKTANGANIIKQQQIIFNNITLIDGVTPVAPPTSVRDLFDKLTALAFFDWYKDGGGGGVNRFTQLLDTFSNYTGKALQFLIVAENELQLTTMEFTPVAKFTELEDTPDDIQALKILQGSPDGLSIIWVDKPAGSNGLNQEFVYTSGDPEFTLGSSAGLSAVAWNGLIMRKADWTQAGNTLTINFTPNSGDIFQPIGNI